MSCEYSYSSLLLLLLFCVAPSSELLDSLTQFAGSVPITSQPLFSPQMSYELSPIIPTQPYAVPAEHHSAQEDTSKAANTAPVQPLDIMVKVSCRKSKQDKMFALSDVDVKDIESIRDLKFYLARKIPVRSISTVGYLVKGRKKVWLKDDGELQRLIHSTLVKGKGTLWCEGLTEVDRDEDSGDDKSMSVASPKRKKTVMEERRAHVQDIFEELREQHGSEYSGPQYRLWAEAIVSGSHDSRSNPPAGTMFKKQASSVVTGHSKVKFNGSKCSATATITTSSSSSPPHASRSSPSSATLTPRSAAFLKLTYIKQIKELHELLAIDAITQEDYSRQKDLILHKMNNM